MVRLFLIAGFSFLCILPIGCGDTEEKPVWEEVKIGDIAPSGRGKPVGRVLKTINFKVYVFEIPAEEIDVLDKVWPMLYTKPLRFENRDTFSANLFSVGFGQTQMWNQIGDMLRDAGGKKTETISMLLPNDQIKELTVAGLDREQIIFYFSGEGTTETVTIGPGRLALRIKAAKVPGLRGVSDVSIQPVFLTSTKGLTPQLAARKKKEDFIFTSVGFGLKMSPRDFVFLGPKKYTDSAATLSGLFFSKAGRKPAVRVYLIICANIID